MRILVCVKQVPDLEQLSIEEEGPQGLTLDEISEYRMNRFDEYAVEAAMGIKEALASEVEVVVHALTVGPERAQDVVRRAMGMGADHGIQLLPPTEIDPGPDTVARCIAGHARQHPYDLILCGSMSEDGMHGQVGSMTASFLGLPCATHVIHLELTEDRSQATIEREIEGGAREILEIRLPVLLSLQSGINQPRYPSLSNLMRANRQALEIVEPSLREGHADGTALNGLVLPPRTRAGRLIEGTSVEKARQLLTLLKEKAFVH